MAELEPADGGYRFASLTRAELRHRPDLVELAGWVDALWYSEGALDRPRERLLPSDWVDIVINLGAPMQLVEGHGTPVLVGGTATGLLTRAAVLGHPTWHRALGMRMHVLAARAVFGPALAELTDWFVTLADVLGADARRLEDETFAASPRAALEAAARWLAARLRAAASAPPDPTLVWVVGAIDRSYGLVPIESLLARSGLARARFASGVRQLIGVTPKRYARLVRFRRALELLDAERPLVDVALAAGFGDQPHMNAEFRALAGTTPREVLVHRYTSGLTVAEDDP